MSVKELLVNKDNILMFFPKLAVILNKYSETHPKEIKNPKTEKKTKIEKNGLEKAIVINQINYWIEINEKAKKNFRDGYYWVYKSYQKWSEQDFEFWSVDTVKRIFSSLEDDGILVSANYNSLGIDRTKWYRINYDKLSEIIKEVEDRNSLV